MKSRKNLSLQFSTLVVATACFVVMGGALLFSQNLKSVLTLWGEDIQLTVYLSQDLEATKQQAIESFLKGSAYVKEVRLITQEKALTDFRTQLATYAPDLVKDDDLLKLIPSSYQLSLDSELSSADKLGALRTIAAQAKQMEGVDEVSFGQDWVEKYSVFVTAIQWMIQILGLIIVSASVFVMSNVIRALIQAHREEIEVLELIGATAGMIRRPFLFQGAQMGFAASALSLVICFGIFRVVKSVFLHQLSFLQLGSHIHFLAPTTGIVFVLAGTALGALGSYLCVRKINDGWAASQRA